MNEIKSKKFITPNSLEIVVDSPQIAKHAKPGQFVILRVSDDGERVPFTICDSDKGSGTITLIIQVVGYTTKIIENMQIGERFHDLTGPLGRATDLSGYKKPMLIGGGIGAAVIYPQAKQLADSGINADVVLGARSGEYVLYKDEFEKNSKNLFIATDDGSMGNKGFVTDILKKRLENGENYDVVFAVGPLGMMKAVCAITKEYGIKTVVSMNSIMIDGTGMCGGCRLTVGGSIKYACVDGPEFDGHQVDFDEAINRSGFYKKQERAHSCRLDGKNP